MSGSRVGTVETADFSMDYFRFGNGRKTLVILPGLSVQSVLRFSYAVAGMYKAFTDDYTVYLFDRRKEVPEGYSVYDMAKDTAEAIRKTGLTDICLYGASQGGMIAMVIAIENPDLVQKLVLASAASRMDEERFAVPGSWAGMAEERNAEKLYLAIGEGIDPAGKFAKLRDAYIELAKTVTPEELERFVILANAVKGFSVAGELDRIRCPVLVIASLDDKVFDAAAAVEIAEEIPGAELYLYDGYGHAVYDNAPDFTRRIMAFFDRD